METAQSVCACISHPSLLHPDLQEYGETVTDLLLNGKRCGHAKAAAQQYVLSGAAEQAVDGIEVSFVALTYLITAIIFRRSRRKERQVVWWFCGVGVAISGNCAVATVLWCCM